MVTLDICSYKISVMISTNLTKSDSTASNNMYIKNDGAYNNMRHCFKLKFY